MNANHMTIGFIGLGLIGGSIAKTIRRIHPDSIIYGFDTNTDSLKAAKEDGTLNQYFETLDSTFSSCDIIFLCAPVSNNIEYLKELKENVSKNSWKKIINNKQVVEEILPILFPTEKYKEILEELNINY